MNKATKQELKRKKKVDRIYLKKLFKVGSKIRKIKPMSKQEKDAILTDLIEGNTYEDLLDVLMADNYTTQKQYFEAIDNYLSFEAATYNYTLPNYTVGAMSDIMQLITNKHRLEALKEKVGMI